MRRATGGVEEQTLSFPMLVTFGALAVALLLFLTNTASAFHEGQELERVERGMLRLRAEYVQQLVSLRRQYYSRDTDYQALLVSIDDLGLTPAELLALHPEDPLHAEEQGPERPEDAGGNTVHRQQLRHVRGN